MTTLHPQQRDQPYPFVDKSSLQLCPIVSISYSLALAQSFFCFVLSDNALQRHVPRVARAFVKVVTHVHNLDGVLDYLECVGKIHQKNGIMVSQSLHESGLITCPLRRS